MQWVQGVHEVWKVQGWYKKLLYEIFMWGFFDRGMNSHRSSLD